jgi:hypothetical protein
VTETAVWTRMKAVAGRFPRAYALARSVRNQARVEWRVLRQVGLDGLLRSVHRSSTDWHRQLPVQAVGRFDLPSELSASVRDFAEFAPRFPGKLPSGTHSIYVPPASFANGPLSALAARYPADAGLKVVRVQGRATERFPFSGDGHSQLQAALLSSHRGLLVAANRLYAEGVGPRMYDLVELFGVDSVWTAYVVADAPKAASEPNTAELLQRLKALTRSGAFSVVVPEGFEHNDFRLPDCSGNARVDATGRPVYVDFQNFVVEKHGEYLSQLANTAAADTHFGDSSMLRGGRYLYQEVPGLQVGGKRGVRLRMQTIDELASAAGLDFSGRPVLDFGCNIGMMMAEYLRRGAAWCVGWDLPTTVVHTEKLLLAVGCTRFSVNGGRLGGAAPVREQIPPFVAKDLARCVVSYLAVRGHFGWLDALTELPWQFLLYEGHENESEDQSRAYLAELNARCKFAVAAEKTYSDGDSRSRYVAILARQRA